MKEGYSLWDYQSKVVEWMETREEQETDGISGGMVCLKMGLGKTLTALYFIMKMRRKHSEIFPTIVLVSKTLMYEWKNEGVEKFFNHFNVLYYHKDLLGKGYQTITTRDLMKYDIVVTTYDVCMSICRKFKMQENILVYGDYGLHKGKVIGINHRDRPEFKEFVGPRSIYELPWHRVFCDESQRFANPKTYTFQVIMSLYAKYRWCLTGTPIRNFDTDIWAQLRFCGFNRILHARLWKKWHFEAYKCINNIYILKYKNAGVKMPKMIDHIHNVKMDQYQKDIYTTLLTRTKAIFDMVINKEISYTVILSLILRLRQTAIAPFMLVSKKKNKNKKIDSIIDKIKNESDVEDWIHDIRSTAGINSPKIKKIVEIIKDVPVGEKIIIFSMFTSCFEILENAMLEDDILYDVLSGETNMKERLRILHQFKNNSSFNVLFVHYKVGGEGINLVQANHVICIEPWWTHAVHNQGIYRAWRRGQNKEVHVHWVLTENTIENFILKLCENKQNMSDSYLYGTKLDQKPAGLSICQMSQLLRCNDQTT
jgi:SNF2 family DNA or RNA helicase